MPKDHLKDGELECHSDLQAKNINAEKSVENQTENKNNAQSQLDRLQESEQLLHELIDDINMISESENNVPQDTRTFVQFLQCSSVQTVEGSCYPEVGPKYAAKWEIGNKQGTSRSASNVTLASRDRQHRPPSAKNASSQNFTMFGGVCQWPGVLPVDNSSNEREEQKCYGDKTLERSTPASNVAPTCKDSQCPPVNKSDSSQDIVMFGSKFNQFKSVQLINRSKSFDVGPKYENTERKSDDKLKRSKPIPNITSMLQNVEMDQKLYVIQSEPDHENHKDCETSGKHELNENPGGNVKTVNDAGECESIYQTNGSENGAMIENVAEENDSNGFSTSIGRRNKGQFFDSDDSLDESDTDNENTDQNGYEVHNENDNSLIETDTEDENVIEPASDDYLVDDCDSDSEVASESESEDYNEYVSPAETNDTDFDESIISDHERFENDDDDENDSEAYETVEEGDDSEDDDLHLGNESSSNSEDGTENESDGVSEDGNNAYGIGIRILLLGERRNRPEFSLFNNNTDSESDSISDFLNDYDSSSEEEDQANSMSIVNVPDNAAPGTNVPAPSNGNVCDLENSRTSNNSDYADDNTGPPRKKQCRSGDKSICSQQDNPFEPPTIQNEDAIHQEGQNNIREISNDPIHLQCNVCYQAGPSLRNKLCSTVCGHVFCQPCARRFMRVRPHCPVCRKKLDGKRIHKLYF